MRLLLITAAIAACGATRLPAQPAAQGQAVYQANCAGCHRPDLAGSGEAPQLAGSNFMNTWGARPASELIGYMQSAMPPSNPGGLGAQAYVDLAAFIFQANGRVAAAQPSEAAAALKEQTTAGRGLTVTGQVKNYVPVTDAMLRNPDPGDWLMIRRDYRHPATARSRKSIPAT
jgi:mono/diheme cytochrome c family protein